MQNSILRYILIIAITLVIGAGVGYYFGYQNNSSGSVAACNLSDQQNTLKVFPNVYHNVTYGFSIQYPAGMQPNFDFTSSYLIPDTWSIFAPATSTGSKIADFVVPHSNNITAGELRVGASNDPSQVKDCTTAPSFAQFKTENKTINGTNFMVLSLSDAATSHYSTVKSYRVVKNNNCIVLDEFVTGTNPEVYDPPTTTPFTMDDAFAKLDAVLNTFSFDK